MENSVEAKVCGVCKKSLPMTDFNKGTDGGYDFSKKRSSEGSNGSLQAQTD